MHAFMDNLEIEAGILYLQVQKISPYQSSYYKLDKHSQLNW